MAINIDINYLNKIIPTRNKWESRQKYADDLNRRIESRDELFFTPVDFYTKIIKGQQYGYIIGVLPGGLKAVVIFNDYKLYLDVDLQADPRACLECHKQSKSAGPKLDQFPPAELAKINARINDIKAKLNDAERKISADPVYEIIFSQSLQPPADQSRFYFCPRPFLRIFFSNKFDYRAAKQALNGYSLYSNESDGDSALFKRIFRESGLNASGWNAIRSYNFLGRRDNCQKCQNMLKAQKTCDQADDHHLCSLPQKRCKCEYPARICADCYFIDWLLPAKLPQKNRPIYIQAKLSDIRPCNNKEQDQISESCQNEYLLTMSWDIETFTKEGCYMVSPYNVEEYICFMITLVFYWHNSDKPIMKMCLVNTKCEAKLPKDLRELAKEAQKYFVEDSIAKHYAKEHKMTMEEAKEALSENIYIIKCPNENAVIRNMSLLCGRYSPDITLAYNCSTFDWPVILAKSAQHTGLARHLKMYMCLDGNYNYKKDPFKDLRPEYFDPDFAGNKPNYILYGYANIREQIKIPGANMTFNNLTVPALRGFVNIDVMLLMRIIHSRAEVGHKYSLNFYVQKIYGLGAKYDLDYKTQWEYYSHHRKIHNVCVEYNKRKSEPEKSPILAQYMQEKGIAPERLGSHLASEQKKARRNMGEEALYCFADSEHCQRLILASGRLQYLIAVSNVTFISLSDTFWRADGSKVRNYLFYQAYKENILVDHQVTKMPYKVKYAGAKVYEPRMGLAEVPVAGLDFSSLYPSIMRAYNCSPEKTIINDGRPETFELVESLKKQGYKLTEVDTIGGKFNKGGSAQDDDLVIEEDFIEGEKVKIKGWLIWHDNKDSAPLDRPLESVGVFPKSVGELIMHRKIYKKKFTILETILEYIAKIEESRARGDKDIRPIEDYLDQILADNGKGLKYFNEDLGLGLEDLQDVQKLTMLMNNYNSAQLALKVICNTFYGQQGSPDSPLYNLLVAGSIPYFGKLSIENVSDIIEEKNYLVHYGDTDSNYLSCQVEKFGAMRREFRRQLAYYWAQLSSDDVIWAKNRDKSIISLYHEKADDDYAKFAEKCAEAMKQFGQIRAKESDLDYDNKTSPDTVLNKFTEAYVNLAQSVHEKAQACLTSFEENNVGHWPNNNIEAFIDNIISEHLYCLKRCYWTAMVQLTRLYINDLQNYINAHFQRKTGTPYLTLNYEEVLGPVGFFGKKKYAGIKHTNKEIFDIKSPKDIFKRGIEIVKQGQSEMNKALGNEILMAILSLDNYYGIERHVIEIGQKYFRQEWPIEYYIQSGKIRPDTDNKAFNLFKEKMEKAHEDLIAQEGYDQELAELIQPPEYNDVFKYVLIRPPSHKIDGCKNNAKKGEKMMYVDHYKYLRSKGDNVQINYKDYIKVSIGTLARFLTYKPELRPNRHEYTEYAEYDKKIIANVKKYLGERFSDIFNDYEDVNLISRRQARKKLMVKAKKAYLAEKAPAITKYINIFDKFTVPGHKNAEKADHISRYGHGPSLSGYKDKFGITQDIISRREYIMANFPDFAATLDQAQNTEVGEIDSETIKDFNEFMHGLIKNYQNKLEQCLYDLEGQINAGQFAENDELNIYHFCKKFMENEELISQDSENIIVAFDGKLQKYFNELAKKLIL